MDALPNIVLVHGAWADGSSWSAVIERLQADGYHVTAPQFPLTTLENDLDLGLFGGERRIRAIAD
jgi:Alpha/beta hydrolase family